MNFVAQLEEYLRDLGVEARKKHPGVKEASERAIMKLRTLQNSYASAVRNASATGEKHPSTTIFRSSDLLHPFLLAANYPNASPKLLDTSFRAMKTLMEADAICPGDGMNLIRVWMIQAQVVVSYSIKDTPSSATQIMGSSGGTLPAGSSKPSNYSTDSVSGGSSSLSSAAQPSGSWLGSFLSNSTNTAKETAKSMTHAVSTKTAVSSSHGQAGSGHLNAKDLEKLALDILSSLLQLLELRDLPVTREQWIQSVTLCCLLYIPSRQNVRQAAHSTLPQVLTLMVKDQSAEDLAIATWEDLLACTLGISHQMGIASKKRQTLYGGFSLCRIGEKDAAQPPSRSLSLDLMTTLLRDAPFVFSRVGQKTLGVVVQVLQRQSADINASPIDYLRVLNFVLVVLQTQAQEWATECRELLSRLLQPIPQATEAIRKHADFEDGFIYKTHNKTLSPSSSNLETLRGLPPTCLWKAALSMETIKALVEEKTLKQIWMHPDVVLQLLEGTSDFCTIGASCEDHMRLLLLACRRKNNSLSYAAESLTSIEQWKRGKTKEEAYILGEALWIGMNVISRVIDCLETDVLESAFAPSLAVLQHYLKRFPASGTIVKRSLEGYFSLARVSLSSPSIRQVLLTSLCKLSLPQWGTHSSGTLLRDHNIAAIICLLNIVHRFFEGIGNDWFIIMQTFQELSILPIASPHLSDNGYVGALSISAVFSRFAAFSTCLSDKSLSNFIEGLRRVSLLGKTTNIITSPVGGTELLSIPRRITDDSLKDEKETIGKTLMNIGVRAIYGGGDAGVSKQDDVPLAERTKNSYSHDYQSEFSHRVADSKHPIRVVQVPFTFSLLVDIAMSNSFRNKSSGTALYRGISNLASDVPVVRNFAMDALAMLIMSQLAGGSEHPATFVGPGEIMYENPRQNQYLAVEKTTVRQQNTEISQARLLGPLCECIRDVGLSSVAEAGVEALHAILETCGHNLNNEAWTTVIEAVGSLPSNERSTDEWSGSCLVGFRCLKLIVDDFADQTDASLKARTSLLDCCASFGSSMHDVNTSLTAIGLLWAIADQDVGTDSIDHALSKLVMLSADTRAEVRNCAVNTFFSCIVGRGASFTASQWESCLCDMVFSIFAKVSASVDIGKGVSSLNSDVEHRKSRYRVSVHHSRDSASKQWVTTQSLVLRGLCRVLRSFFGDLLRSTDDGSGTVDKKEDTPWFENAWNKILGFGFEAATQVGGRDTLDLRNAGVELLVLCSQLSCKAGIHAAIIPARVGTNMEVVNGALRSVRSPEKNDNSKRSTQVSHSAVTEMWRENLFLDAFDVLDSFREHLESDASNHNELGLHHTLEPTQVQVLNKFAEDMSKLYECGKDYEFAEDRTFNNVSSFEKQLLTPREKFGDGDALVSRFAQIIAAVATRASSGPDSRFLSQAQRSCMDIFRTMSSDGSPEAFLTLSDLASATIFLGYKTDKAQTGANVLANEASDVLREEVQKEYLSDECKVLVACRILSLLSNNDLTKRTREIETHYGLLLPILLVALPSAKSLQMTKKVVNGPKGALLDFFWEKTYASLTELLTPIENESMKLEILRPLDVAEFARSASANTPFRRINAFGSILMTGASKCLNVAILEKDLRLRENYLTLFAACFSGVCVVDPNDRALADIAEQVLASALPVLSGIDRGNGVVREPLNDVHVQACLMICNAMQSCDKVEPLAIAVFPQLCKLVGVEEAALRRAVGGVLAKLDIARVIAEADALRLAAEERAIVAEIRVVELSTVVEKLRAEKESMERQRSIL